MKKVLVMTSTFPRFKGDSTPSFVSDLHSSMKGYSFFVLAPHHRKAKRKEIMGGMSVERFSYFPSKYQKLAYGAGMLSNAKSSFLAKFQIPLFLHAQYNHAKKIIENNGIDCIHAHWVLPQGILAAKLSKQYGIPLVVTIHGSDIFALKGAVFKRMQRAVVNQASVITVNSESTKKKLLTMFPLVRKKVHLVSMGIDTSLFKPKKTVRLKKKTILFVGRLTEQKGVQHLISSMPAVLKKVDAHLIVVGDGEYKKTLKDVVRKNDVASAVSFLESKSKKDLVDLYNKADVFVLPSVSGKNGVEGFGLVLAEAMACGVLVIGSSSGGIPEVVKHGKTGLIFKEKNVADLSKQVIKILSDSKLSKKLSVNGKKYAKKNFDWKIISRKFEKLYKVVV